MNRKYTIGLLALVGVLVYGIVLINENNTQQEQLADYQQHDEQLLSDIENSTLDRLSLEQQLEELRNDLLSQNSQISTVSQQLDEARLQINPDYQQIENDLRLRLTREISQELQARNNSQENPQLNLLKQLGELAPDEFRQLISLQTQFGGYLQSLDISDVRMELVVGALSNMIEEQTQVTRDFVSQMQSQDQGDGFNPLAMRSQIMEINSPESQIETLSYSLNQQELDAFSDYLAEQQNQATQIGISSFSFPGPAGAAPSAVFIGNGQSGSFRAEAIQISPAQNLGQN